MNTSDGIKAIMSELITGYNVLQTLLQKERACLINLNAAQIEDLSKEKDTIVMRLKLLEDERKRLLKNYYIEKGIQGEMDLRIFYKLTGDDSFESLRLKLISLIQSIAELNEFNRILIDRSVNFFKNTIGFLDSSGLNINYAQKANMLSREV